MKCEEFETLLADALGDELLPADRMAFEEHVGRCDTCRREYETARRTLDELCSLSAPRQVSLRDIDSALVPDVALRFHAADSGKGRLTPSYVGPRGSFVRVLRYAASLLIAFTAGYALHAGVTLSGHAGSQAIPPSVIAVKDGARAQTLADALARVHLQQPARSALAKAMIAMVPRR